MQLKIMGKEIDLTPFQNVLRQGEKGCEFVEIVADRYYEGTDLSSLIWRMDGTYIDYDSTVELSCPCTPSNDKVTFAWRPNEFFTAYPGGQTLTLVGEDNAGNKIIKITGNVPIVVQENQRKLSNLIIPSQVTSIEQSVKDCAAYAQQALTAAAQASSDKQAVDKAAADFIKNSSDFYTKSQSNARFAGALVVKESGNPITIYPDATGAPITAVSLRGKTTQSGTGDPSPTNIRPISGISASISVNGTVYAPSVPIKLYGQNEVYDTWEPCVMVDGVLRSRLTQRFGCLVLDGTESISINNSNGKSRFLLTIAQVPPYDSATKYCTHGKTTSNATNCYGADGMVAAYANGVVYFNFGARTNIADMQSYLAAQKYASTPVTIVHQLATPIVTLGDPYTIPNAAGNVTISAENTVDVTYNKSLAKAFEQITAAIASLGTV